ncbi:putative tail tip protein [Escherichia phage vB_EcoD_Pubbukkers]|uniref:Tail tip protein n=1 Tax=Escherichia phage vB_EcoD_Pubbukkers TaxID=2894793 RepID=A0AAE9CDL7_9CAUD|nr:putative tail tip protein [Escherichia phage vB_EcoD_Pubbukkers]UGO49997.1 putative tail tip protein [Escherichia phage vB_EcoD_Pubbukkers]
MAAGTLSVTNNSKAVVGVGTTFTSFNAGDFLTLVVGQVPYTVAIASIESETALTLVLPFDGPTATGLAWDGVKRDTMSLATMGVTVQAQKALRLMIADENNWRAIFGDAEEITVTLPNGQVMQGMSWGYLSQLMKQIDPVEMRNLQQQAAASEAAAQGFRDQAEEWAKSVNPDNLLTKSGNLAGLADKGASWANLMPPGPLRIGADPVNHLDAATKGWVWRGLDDVGLWGLRNNYASEPAGGAEVYGGRFDSSMNVAGAEKYRMSIQLQGLNNVDAWTRLATVDASSMATEASWDFKYDGKIIFNKGLSPSSTSASPGNTYVTLANTWMGDQYSGHVGFVGGGAGTSGGGWRNFISFGALIHPPTGNSHPHAMIAQVFDYDLASGTQPNGDIVRNTTFNPEAYDITFGNNSGTVNYIFAKSPVSDRALKHDIARIDTQVAYDNVMTMEYSSFVYNYDKKETVRRGFIAQQLEEIDPQYVRKYTNATGKEFLALDENVLLLDLVATVQHLAAKVEALESKLAEK